MGQSYLEKHYGMCRLMASLDVAGSLTPEVAMYPNPILDCIPWKTLQRPDPKRMPEVKWVRLWGPEFQTYWGA